MSSLPIEIALRILIRGIESSTLLSLLDSALKFGINESDEELGRSPSILTFFELITEAAT